MSNRKQRRETAKSPRGRDMPAWLALLILASAICSVYGRSLTAPWIFDDSLSVLQNRSILSLLPLVGDADHPGPFHPLIENPMSARPLVNLSLAVNYQFGQFDPRGYRAVSIALHILNSLILWAIAWRTLRLPYFGDRFERSAKWLALGVAALWALHPLVTEAVVYVTQRTELMVTLFYLTTLYACLRYWTTEANAPRTRWLVLAALASLAGAASKEVMVSAPLVVLLFDRTFVGGSAREVWRRSWRLYVCLATSWLLIAALQLGTPRSASAGFGLGVPLVSWWSTQAQIFMMYLKLALWPAPLALHYQFPVGSFRANWIWVFMTAVLAVVTVALVWRRSAIGFALSCVFLILAPTHIFPIVTEMAAERRMYLPLAALVSLFVVGAYSLVKQASARADGRWPAVAAGSLLLVLGVVYATASASRVAEFRDPLALWQDNVSVQPGNHVAQLNLASALAAAGRTDDALEHYRESVRLNPEFNEGRYQLGLALAASGQLDAAIGELREVVRRQPDAYKIRNNFGVVLFSAGRLPEAVAEFEKTLELKPDFAEAQENLNRARRASVLPNKAE